jgi:hypothetical protein
VVGNLRNESATFTISSADTHYIDGGNLVNAGTITHSDDGALNIGLSGTLVNESGALYDITGDGDILANTSADTASNAGTLRKGGTGTTVINAPLTNTGTLAIESGRMLFAGANALTLDGSSTLTFKLSGADEAMDYGRLEISHELMANGELEVTLAPGYSPSLGDTFNILDWSTISGEFDNIVLPALTDADMAWNTSQLYITGEITAGLAGDYNFDGAVDAADHVVLRKQFDTPSGYSTWRQNFGRAIPSGDGSSDAGDTRAVPEPAAVALMFIGFLAMAVCRLR